MTDLYTAPPEITLWDWQEEAVDRLRANIRAGIRNQVLCSPTGSGKTRIAAYMIQSCYRRNQRAIFVVDRDALVQQTSDLFDELGIPHGVIQGNHWRTDYDQPIQIATAQTLARRSWPRSDLIVVDEAHSMYRDTLCRIAKRDTVTIGLTATPFTRGMGRYYDAVVNVRTLNQLTEEGYLAPFVAYAPAEPDMTGAKVNRFGEWTDADAEKRSLAVIGDAVDEYLEKTPGKKFLCFGVTIAHCAELQRQFLAAGVQCALYTADTPDEERAALVEEFRNPDGYLRGLISVAALSKGFDVPSVEVVIVCRPLRRSLAEHIQMIGRGLRRDPDNPGKVCTILDLSGNMLRFYQSMTEFFEHGVHELDDGKPKPQRKQAESTAPEPYKCPRCAAVHKPARMCPSCGHEYPRRNPIEHLPGKLVAMSAGSITTVEGLHQDVYSQLLWIAYERGFAKPDGWAAHKFRALFGKWPDGLQKIRKPPTEKTANWVRSEYIRWAKAQKKAGKASTYTERMLRR